MPKKLKQKSNNWAANLERMATHALQRLPPIKVRPVTPTLPALHASRCSWCKERGHNVRTCRQAQAAQAARSAPPKRVRAPVISRKIIVDRRAVAVRPLAGKAVLHAAYDQAAQTLHLAFKGQFKVHWYAYANVPQRLFGELMRAKDVDAFVAERVDPKFTKTYVHRRKPLPKAPTK